MRIQSTHFNSTAHPQNVNRWPWLLLRSLRVFAPLAILVCFGFELKRQHDDTNTMRSLHYPLQSGVVISSNEPIVKAAESFLPDSSKPASSSASSTSLSSAEDDKAAKKKLWERTRPRSLHLLGERHSGTTWMENHLRECFNHSIYFRTGLTRWKHWFQNDGEYAERKAVVVVQFRDAYQWVEAMRKNPYHSPDHFNMGWREFVNSKWAMERTGVDRDPYKLREIQKQQGQETICQERFRPYDVIPCVETDKIMLNITGEYGRLVRTLYELRHDGSGQPYDSILELRRDKILNFLSIRNFTGVKHLELLKYEDMAQNGTAWLIKKLEKLFGIKAKCEPFGPQRISARPLRSDYVRWMLENVDWETEALIGYKPNVLTGGGLSSNEEVISGGLISRGRR